MRFSTFASLALAVIFLKINTLHGQEPQAAFQNGNRAAEKGDWAEAARQYESALADAPGAAVSPDLEANLARVFAQQKQFAKAILHYERALLLAPNERVWRSDLALLRKRAVVESYGNTAPFLLVQNWRELRATLRPDAWAWLTVGLAWLSATGFWFGWRAENWGRRHAARWAFAVFGLAAALALALALSAAGHARDSGEGVVLAAQSPVFTAPDAAVPTLDTLRAGAKIALPDRIGDWWKVQLPDGEEGWMPVGAVEEI